MNEITYGSAFLVGLAGSVHCVGMCGGVISAFSFATPQHANKEIYALAYNIGRIATYTMLGALTGLIGNIVNSSLLIDFPLLQAISILFLFLLAFYISDVWKGLSQLERIGRHIWKKIQPLSKKLIPVNTLFHAMCYGAVWGFLPCGLIYSALTWSLASGDALTGAGMMLSFGLGTLPALLLVSFGLQTLLPVLQHPYSRKLIALLLFASGIFLLSQLISGTVI